MLILLVQAVPQEEGVRARLTPKDAMVCAIFSIESLIITPYGGAHDVQTSDRTSLFDGDGSVL